MEFSFTEEYKQIEKTSQNLAREFATRASEHDRDATAPMKNYEALRNVGFHSLTVPKEFGGRGVGLVGYVIAAEEFAQGCAATAPSFNMHVSVVFTLMHSPIPDSTKQMLTDLVVKEGSYF